MTETTTPEIAAAASHESVLPMDETALIGVFLGQEPTALLRLSDGQIVKVGVGTRVGEAEIVAIDETGLQLNEGGRETALTLPG